MLYEVHIEVNCMYTHKKRIYKLAWLEKRKTRDTHQLESIQTGTSMIFVKDRDVKERKNISKICQRRLVHQICLN